jgi:hypothetical protein
MRGLPVFLIGALALLLGACDKTEESSGTTTPRPPGEQELFDQAQARLDSATCYWVDVRLEGGTALDLLAHPYIPRLVTALGGGKPGAPYLWKSGAKEGSSLGTITVRVRKEYTSYRKEGTGERGELLSGLTAVIEGRTWKGTGAWDGRREVSVTQPAPEKVVSEATFVMESIDPLLDALARKVAAQAPRD